MSEVLGVPKDLLKHREWFLRWRSRVTFYFFE